MVSLVVPTDAPVVHGPPQGRWTVSDWEKLPDDGNRYEIIEGFLYMSTPPGFTHQWVISRLHKLIGIPAEERVLGTALFAPIGVFMPGCDPVQPDFLFVTRQHTNHIQERGIFGVPCLIIEVLSPSNRSYDEAVKLQTYANAGVPEYATIDPIARTLRLNRAPKQGVYEEIEEFDATQSVVFICLPTITLEISKLFEGAPHLTP